MPAETDIVLAVPPTFPGPGEPTVGRRMLEHIIDGSLPGPPCVRRLALPRATGSRYGQVTANLVLTQDLTWRPGVVFGGYLAGLIDQFAALAMLTVLPDGMTFLSATVAVDFDVPVSTGEALITATVTSLTARQAWVEVVIEQGGQVGCRGRAHQVLQR